MTGPLWAAALAKAANRLWGTALGPWDIGALDEPTLDLIEALAFRSPVSERGLKRIADAKKRYWEPFEKHQQRH